MEITLTFNCSSGCCTPPICKCDSPIGSGPPGTLPASFCLTLHSASCSLFDGWVIRYSSGTPSSVGGNWTIEYPMTDPIASITDGSYGYTASYPNMFGPVQISCGNGTLGTGTGTDYVYNLSDFQLRWSYHPNGIGIAPCYLYLLTMSFVGSGGWDPQLLGELQADPANVNCAAGTMTLNGLTNLFLQSQTINDDVACNSYANDWGNPEFYFPYNHNSISGCSPGSISATISTSGCGCFDPSTTQDIPDPSVVLTLTATITIGGNPYSITLNGDSTANNPLGCIYYADVTAPTGCRVRLGMKRAFWTGFTNRSGAYVVGYGGNDTEDYNSFPGQYVIVYYCGSDDTINGNNVMQAPLVIDSCSPFTSHVTSGRGSSAFGDSLCETTPCAGGLFNGMTLDQ